MVPISKQEFSIPKLAQLRSEAEAYLLLENLRWGGKPDACPHCRGMERIYFLTPKDGTDTRKTRTGSRSERRVWKCGHCRKQFSVLTGTIFHGTKISVRTWLMVIFEFCSAKNSISAREVARKYEITPESAWHMIHRIREATKREPLVGFLRGAVQARRDVDRWQLEQPARERQARDAMRLRTHRHVAGVLPDPLRDA
jgi:transposase-like protein